jgi:hypothetical protein
MKEDSSQVILRVHHQYGEEIRIIEGPMFFCQLQPFAQKMVAIEVENKVTYIHMDHVLMAEMLEYPATIREDLDLLIKQLESGRKHQQQMTNVHMGGGMG